MQEDGIDLSQKQTQRVYDLVKAQSFYGYVITVCNRAKENDCPIFPGMPKRIPRDLENPEDYTGSYEEKLNNIKALKEEIKALITEFIEEFAAE